MGQQQGTLERGRARLGQPAASEARLALRYRAIHDYAIIGDCRSCALINSDGGIDWACLPRFDSPALFARLLDMKRGGSFQITSARPSKKDRSYVHDTNVLVTTFQNEDGTLEITDFMPMFDPDGARTPQYVIRIVRCRQGMVRATMSFEPRFQYGRDLPTLAASSGEVRAGGEGECVVLQSEVPVTLDEHGVHAEFALREGERRYFVMRFAEEGEKALPAKLTPEQVEGVLKSTVSYWQDWTRTCNYEGPHRDKVARSALTLKLLTYEPTGGIVAAATTSLPEKIGGERNWDYRYVWLRDAAFVVQALWEVGHMDDAERFLDFIADTAEIDGEQLGVVYSVTGERYLEEKELDHLEGYRRSKPVRIGNGAYEQRQLDVYGDVLHCADLVRRHGKNTEKLRWDRFRKLVDWVCDHWHESGKGIWEVRSEDRHFVHSKVMAWVALDRGIGAVEDLGLPADIERWRAVREEIRETVMSRGWSEKLRSFGHAFEHDWMDAANLRLPLVGFLPVSHPKMQATIERTLEVLTKDAFVYRYLEVEDGLSGGEGTFTVCSFWLVANLARLGRLEQAHANFDKLCAQSNDLGLFAEELDPSTGEHLGNFPQAFTHVGLITAAYALKDAEAQARSNKGTSPA